MIAPEQKQQVSLAWLMIAWLALAVCLPAPGAALLVADMEGPVAFRAYPFGQTNSPQATLTAATAAEGRRGLRFAFDADGVTPASVAFPFTNSLSGFSVLAFEFYCERDNGGQLTVTVHPQGDADRAAPVAAYGARVQMSEGRDGWVTMRLVKDRTLQIRGAAGRPTRWETPRAISFGLNEAMKGRVVFYLDHIRFEQAAVDNARNLLLNSSFEQTTNPDSPDAWRRDFDQPPFGPDVWRIDRATAWDGKNSLRLGAAGKTAFAWSRPINLTPGQDHVFSVYLKSDRAGTRARLEVNGLNKPNHADFTVGPEWQRFALTGKAFRGRTSATVTLLTHAVLWLDAAQLEDGTKPSPYHEAAGDNVPGCAMIDRPTIPEPLNKPPRQASMRRAAHAPRIDGDLSDTCWNEAAPMTDFVGLEASIPSAFQTTARMAFDDANLYLAVFAADPDMASVRELLNKATKVWSADSIEVFLDFNGDRRSYGQFIVNAKGLTSFERFDPPRQRVPWEADWQAAVSTTPAGWTVEMAIPFRALNLTTVPPAGRRIGLNICRTRKARNTGGQDAYSSWSFSHGTFHNPRAFGEVAGFDASVLAPYLWAVDALTWSRGAAQATLRNLTGAEALLDFRFVARSDGKTNVTESVARTVAAGGTADVKLPLGLPEDGFYRVGLEGRSRDGTLRLSSQPAEIRVSGTSLYSLVGPEFDFYTTDVVARVRSFIEADPETCRDLRIDWRLDGVAEPRSPGGSFRPVPGENTWTVALADLPAGSYTIMTEVLRGDTVKTSVSAPLRKEAPAEHEVRINRWGRYVVADGKPLLPFGWFDSSIARRVPLADWDAVVAEMAANGCTVFPAYTGSSTNLADCLGGYLDSAWTHGVRLWVHLDGFLMWQDPRIAKRGNRFMTREAAEEALTRVVGTFRNHPALMGWLTYDEPGNRPDLAGGAAVLASYRLVKRLDPVHPCFCSHLNHMGDSVIYGPGSDIALMPFLERGGRYDHLFHEFWEAGMPVFINAPCYGAAGSALREPTPVEQRVRTYKGIILGARGVQYYTFRPASQQLWKSMGALGAELRLLAPALLTPDERLALDVTPGNGELLATLRRAGPVAYLIAVNTSARPVDAVFHLGAFPGAGRATPWFGAPVPKSDAAGRRLSVTMDGMSTAVYRIEKE